MMREINWAFFDPPRFGEPENRRSALRADRERLLRIDGTTRLEVVGGNHATHSGNRAIMDSDGFAPRCFFHFREPMQKKTRPNGLVLGYPVGRIEPMAHLPAE